MVSLLHSSPQTMLGRYLLFSDNKDEMLFKTKGLGGAEQTKMSIKNYQDLMSKEF